MRHQYLLSAVITSLKIYVSAANGTVADEAENEPCSFPCEYEAQQSKIGRIEQSLDSFLELLKSYVTANEFGYNNYNRDVDSLRDRFYSMESRLENVDLSQGLSERLDFAAYLMKAMASCAQVLDFYKFPRFPAEGILFKLIELKVRALVILDLRPQLDSGKNGHVVQILHLSKSLSLWKETLGDTVTLPLGFHLIFETELFELEMILSFLINLIPALEV